LKEILGKIEIGKKIKKIKSLRTNLKKKALVKKCVSQKTELQKKIINKKQHHFCYLLPLSPA
jgi:hypothetical protein